MKITFLGTGHGIGTPDRACSATLIETGGSLYLIDGGVDLSPRIQAAGYSPARLKAIFTTHAHGDHISGIYGLVDLFNWCTALLKCELDVFFTEVGVTRATEMLVNSTTRPHDSKRLRMRTAAEGVVYTDSNVRVSYFPTQHMAWAGRPSFGILVECEGKRLYFSGDLSDGLSGHDFPALVTMIPTDLCVMELAHIGLENIDNFLPRIQTVRLAFNHVYPTSRYQQIDALKGKYKYEVLTPKDMDSIVIQ